MVREVVVVPEGAQSVRKLEETLARSSAVAATAGTPGTGERTRRAILKCHTWRHKRDAELLNGLDNSLVYSRGTIFYFKPSRGNEDLHLKHLCQKVSMTLACIG